MKQEVVTIVYTLDQIKAVCAEEIAEYGLQFEIMYKLYMQLGLDYPEECNTNYRDSWFHYRKLYKKKDYVVALNEKYGLEEHLLRTAKDAQICFLQQLGYWLEVWCRHDEYMSCDLTLESKIKDMLNSLDENWVCSIYNKANDEVLFANACLYRYINLMQSAELQKKLQKLVNSIKNIILELRLGGINISRPADNIAYLKKCVDVYNEMCESLQSVGILYLLSATQLILTKCSKK